MRQKYRPTDDVPFVKDEVSFEIETNVITVLCFADTGQLDMVCLLSHAM